MGTAFICSLHPQIWASGSKDCLCRGQTRNVVTRFIPPQTSPRNLCMFPRWQWGEFHHASSRACAKWRALIGGGGFLGVGTPELLVIVVVGWLVLGPSRLYELARDMGKIIGQLRRTAEEARETFTEALEMDVAAMRDADKAEVGENTVVGEREVDETVNRMADAVGPLEEEAVRPVPEEADGNGVKKVLTKGDMEIANRRQFLSQLTRVNDPNQVPPATVHDELGDLDDLDMSKEMELEELDRIYREERKRVLQKHDERRSQIQKPEKLKSESNSPPSKDM